MPGRLTLGSVTARPTATSENGPVARPAGFHQVARAVGGDGDEGAAHAQRATSHAFDNLARRHGSSASMSTHETDRRRRMRSHSGYSDLEQSAIVSGVRSVSLASAARLRRVRRPRATFAAIVQAPTWVPVLVGDDHHHLSLRRGVPADTRSDGRRWSISGSARRSRSARPLTMRSTRAWRTRRASGSFSLLYAAATALASGPALALALSGVLFVVLNRERRAVARARGPQVSYVQVLAVVSYAGVILALRQVIATPVDYVRESIASPTTLVQFFTMLDEASPLARFLGVIDLFVVWWIVVLAIGVSVLYRRPDPPPRARLHRRLRRARAAGRARDGGVGRNGVKRRTWLIVVGARPARRRRNRRAHLSEPQQPAGRDRRSDSRARSRRDRVGVREDPAEAPGQRLGDHDGTRHAAGGPGRPARQGGTVPARNRPAIAGGTARTRRGQRGGGAVGAAAGDAPRSNRRAPRSNSRSRR